MYFCAMALTETTDKSLGFTAPDFTLPNPRTGKKMSLEDIKGAKATVFVFMCNHCPYVKHVISGLVAAANDYQAKGIAFVGINSNDVANYPEDSPELMRDWANELQFPFPYLYDETQEVAKAYDAACTPDIAMFDTALKCVYRGRLDGATPGNNKPNNGEDLRAAMDTLLSGASIENQIPSMGCNIKWK